MWGSVTGREFVADASALVVQRQFALALCTVRDVQTVPRRLMLSILCILRMLRHPQARLVWVSRCGLTLKK